MTSCIICKDKGWWVDEYAQKTMYCPLCQPQNSDNNIEFGIDGWVTSRWVQYPAKYWDGPRFQIQPWMIVIHSGAYRANIAEFFNKSGLVVYRSRKTKVNAHINYSVTYETFVQSVPFNIVGKHCGGSKWRDKRTGKLHTHLNFCSIGIELPGPVGATLPMKVIDHFRATIVYLLEVVPSLNVAVRHRDIDPRKKDPGINFDYAWISDLGLYLPFYKAK